jgi:hypothetical protein
MWHDNRKPEEWSGPETDAKHKHIPTFGHQNAEQDHSTIINNDIQEYLKRKYLRNTSNKLEIHPQRYYEQNKF